MAFFFLDYDVALGFVLRGASLSLEHTRLVVARFMGTRGFLGRGYREELVDGNALIMQQRAVAAGAIADRDTYPLEDVPQVVGLFPGVHNFHDECVLVVVRARVGGIGCLSLTCLGTCSAFVCRHRVL